MDLACPFCHAPMLPGDTGCARCGSAAAGTRGGRLAAAPAREPTTASAPASATASGDAGRSDVPRLRALLASAVDTGPRSAALDALARLVRRRGRLRLSWPWRRVAATPGPAPRSKPRGPRSPVREGAPPWAVSAVFHTTVLVIVSLLTVAGAPRKAMRAEIDIAQRLPAVAPLPELPAMGNSNLLTKLSDAPPAEPIPADVLDTHAETPDDSPNASVREAERPDIAPLGSTWGWRGRSGRRLAAAMGGGTWGSEHAVKLGLAWLAAHQQPEGCWAYHPDQEICAPPEPQQRPGLTALAVLCFVGAGHVPGGRSQYGATVRRGCDWLVSIQADRGSLQGGISGGMYHHVIAALALCEAAGIGGDPRLRAAAEAAIAYLRWAQNADGGWRYLPRTGESDSSVTGWAVMALAAARTIGMPGLDEPLKRARGFIDSVTIASGECGYQRPSGGIAALTAVGLLCRELTGAVPQDPLVRGAAELLSGTGPVWDLGPARRERKTFVLENPINFYEWYYKSMSLIHHGGEPWKKWNPPCRDLLVRHQQLGEGCIQGSWDPCGLWSGGGGRVYSTAMSVLTLEVYYRAAPAFLKPPADELAVLPRESAFHGEALYDRAVQSASRARTALASDPGSAIGALGDAQGTLTRFREWAAGFLTQPAPEGRAEVTRWLRLVEREEGEIALLRGDRARGLALMLPVLTREPDAPGTARVRRLVARALLDEATARREAGDATAAGEAERRALPLMADILDRGEEPDAARARELARAVADLEARVGQPAQAALRYRRLLDGATGDEADALRRKLAGVLVRAKDWAGALKALGLLAARDGEVPVLEAARAAGALADRIRQEGDPAEAVSLFREVLAKYGTEAKASEAVPALRRGLAEALEAAGRTREAADEWLGLAKEGGGVVAELRAAAAMVKGGRAVEARDLAAKLQGTLLAFSAPWWEARAVFAEALLAEGDAKGARAIVENTRLLYPELGGDATRERFLEVLRKAGG